MKVEPLLNFFDVILVRKTVDVNPVYAVVPEVGENFFKRNVQIPVVMFTVVTDHFDNRSLRDFMVHVNNVKAAQGGKWQSNGLKQSKEKVVNFPALHDAVQFGGRNVEDCPPMRIIAPS